MCTDCKQTYVTAKDIVVIIKVFVLFRHIQVDKYRSTLNIHTANNGEPDINCDDPHQTPRLKCGVGSESTQFTMS